MSNLLAFDSYLIPLGSTADDVKTNIIGALTSRGWQVVGESIAYNAVTTYGAGPFNVPANLFNGYGGNDSQGGSPGVVQVKLNSPQAITKYELWPRVANPSSAIGLYWAPRDWTLEWADDAGGVPGAWTVADTRNLEDCPVQRGTGERPSYTVGGTPGAHLYWRLNFGSATNIGQQIYISQIRLFTAANTWIEENSQVYVRPPASEVVGDAFSEEVVGFRFTGTFIHIFGSTNLKTAMPQTLMFKETGAGGAVACSVSIPGKTPVSIVGSISGSVLTVTSGSGITVGSQLRGPYIYGGQCIASFGTGTGGPGTYNLTLNQQTAPSSTFQLYPAVTITGATGTALSTAKDNLRALYVALKNSSNPIVLGWTWWYSKPAPQNANDTADYIYGTCTTAERNIIVTPNANCLSYICGNYAPPGIAALCSTVAHNITNGSYSDGMKITIDLISGFIIYFQINSRGFALATKTNAAYYGPLRACYGDHAKAVASLPTTPHPRGLSPIELVVGYDGPQGNFASYGWPARNITMCAAQYGYPHFYYDDPNQLHGDTHSGFSVRDQFTTMANPHQYDAGYVKTALSASGVFLGNTAAADDFQIHRMVMNGHSTGDTVAAGAGSSSVVPAMDLQDWYRFRGSATNEALALAADAVALTSLLSNMDDATLYTTVSLADASPLAPAGFVVVEGEVIQYTGKSGNTLTGVTRAKYGTSKQAHWIGDQVYQGLWFTIINGGALFCGYTKPA